MEAIDAILTRRQRLVELLTERAWTFAALRAEVAVPTHVLADDLAHLRRSLARRHGPRLTVIATECPSCGFVFTDRDRFTEPSRCPRCREEALLPARFAVVASGASPGSPRRRSDRARVREVAAGGAAAGAPVMGEVAAPEDGGD